MRSKTSPHISYEDDSPASLNQSILSSMGQAVSASLVGAPVYCSLKVLRSSSLISDLLPGIVKRLTQRSAGGRDSIKQL